MLCLLWARHSSKHSTHTELFQPMTTLWRRHHICLHFLDQESAARLHSFLSQFFVSSLTFQVTLSSRSAKMAPGALSGFPLPAAGRSALPVEGAGERLQEGQGWLPGQRHWLSRSLHSAWHPWPGLPGAPALSLHSRALVGQLPREQTLESRLPASPRGCIFNKFHGRPCPSYCVVFRS